MRIDPSQDKTMRERLHPRRARGATMPLLREVLQLAGPCAELARHAEKPWASVTFSGSRQTLCLRFSGPYAFDAADDFIAALPDHEFTLPGHVVVDAAIIAAEQVALPAPRVSVEADLLLLEDC